MKIEDIVNRNNFISLLPEDEKYVVAYLRSMPEDEALDIILDMVKQKSLISLGVAKKVLHKKQLVVQLLEYGFKNTDAQRINRWLQFGIVKLGARSVIRLIDELSVSNLKLADYALYWLPPLIPKKETKTWSYFEIFKSKIEARKTQKQNQDLLEK